MNFRVFLIYTCYLPCWKLFFWGGGLMLQIINVPGVYIDKYMLVFLVLVTEWHYCLALVFVLNMRDKLNMTEQYMK